MKTKHLLIEVPEGWKPGLHEKCAMQKVCIVTDVYDENGFPCPLASAKKAVEVNRDVTVFAHGQANPHWVGGKPVTLYAVEIKP